MKMKHSFFLITSKSENFSLEISAKEKNFPWLFSQSLLFLRQDNMFYLKMKLKMNNKPGLWIVLMSCLLVITSCNVDNRKIVYTSETAVAISDTLLETHVVKHTFKDGVGVIVLDKECNKIPDKAFFESSIETITLPPSIQYIGQEAFYFSKKLKKVNIPYSGCLEIGNSAFAGCAELNKIDLPNSLSRIGIAAFSGCNKLDSIILPSSINSIGGSAFAACEHLKVLRIFCQIDSIQPYSFFVCSSLEDICIPESVSFLGESSFAGCRSIRQITIPNKVTVITDHLLFDCQSLESVTILGEITSIEDYAFSGCSKLQTIFMNNRVDSIGYKAFGGCDNLLSTNFKQ